MILARSELGGTSGLTPSKVVDEVWHAHVLRSEEYAAFCSKYVGWYVHHQPTNVR